MNNIEIKNIKGNITKVFAKTFEYEAYEQVKQLANCEAYQDSTIRIMPDAHAGKGCTIGTTMTITDKVTPNLVGVDIGCGMFCVNLGNISIDFDTLDNVIHNFIPSGRSIRSGLLQSDSYYTIAQGLDRLKCLKELNISRAMLSLGTLGGGNHFIEIDENAYGTKYLIIHSGSRNLGVQVCKYYQEKAITSMSKDNNIQELISKLKKEGREKEIESTIKGHKKPTVNKELAYLTGKDFEDYCYDLKIVHYYAKINRELIAKVILSNMKWNSLDAFHTVHNYIDLNRMILRKGAVSAELGQNLLIPLNMRDGSLICTGKGNPDWNYSAPHGAGRLMSRSKAKENISMEDYKDSMNGIFTTSVNTSTIDESPQAYKPMDEIILAITDTVEVIDIIKPIYNFKASEY